MANCIGIIAEYNPFHNGHKYHIAKSKAQQGNAPVIVVMSMHFVQRGDVALHSPYLRARNALENGADMVLGLPVSFSLSGAERFAAGGVATLNATGIVDKLSFGSENADILFLSRLAEVVDDNSEPYKKALATELSAGKSFPAARAFAIESLLGRKSAAALSAPNNILGIEYIRALNRLNSPIKPLAIERIGAAHDSNTSSDKSFMSASAIRQSIINSDYAPVCHAVPHGVYEDILSQSATLRTVEKIEQSVIYALRRMSISQLADLPDVGEGLENVLYSACRSANSFESLTSSIKTKRYTLARIRRICLNAYLGISKADHAASPLPRYIRVLGAGKDSLPLLSEMCQNTSLPVVIGKEDYNKLDPAAKRDFDKDILSSELAELDHGIKSEFSQKLIIV